LAGSLPQTPLEELTVLPQTPSWFKEALYLRGGEGKGSKGRGVRERRGVEWKGREEREVENPHQFLCMPLLSIPYLSQVLISPISGSIN